MELLFFNLLKLKAICKIINKRYLCFIKDLFCESNSQEKLDKYFDELNGFLLDTLIEDFFQTPDALLFYEAK
jgi:hypothetical protein